MFTFFMTACLLKKQPDHEHVISLLEDYMAEWDKLGRAFGLSFPQRDNIRYDGTRPKNLDKLNAVVNTWIKEQTSVVTWEHFIEAMQGEKLNQLASNIRDFLKRDDIRLFYSGKPCSACYTYYCWYY